ncbi:biotin/lipoyl-binding protein [Pseudarcicella hirudinis]|uniref:biotin/lipoyl-binding protein n=1 Tax=Pseudarcicella hirudinis TaxID=1079859 RepID=UPI0035E5C0A8
MKTKYLLLSTVLLIASCSKPTDKKAELASLKTQQKELEGKIKVLEKELGAGSEGKKENEKIVAVTVTPLASQNFKHFVEVQGVVEAENTINVGPQTGGAITSLLVKVGDPVSKGQLIATIDNSILKESLEEIKQQLSLATTLYESRNHCGISRSEQKFSF